MGTIRNYPTPEGAVLQKDFQIRVRAAGQAEWQEVSCYQVKVDMHEVRCASMAYFDFPRKRRWKSPARRCFLYIRWMCVRYRRG